MQKTVRVLRLLLLPMRSCPCPLRDWRRFDWTDRYRDNPFESSSYNKFFIRQEEDEEEDGTDRLVSREDPDCSRMMETQGPFVERIPAGVTRRTHHHHQRKVLGDVVELN